MDQEEVLVESAAAKKRRKKKEKEKEKKKAEKCDEKKTESTTKSEKNAVNDKVNKVEGSKKVPKHVRMIQEELARRKEAEEKAKREEEERLRRQEEERQKQEELKREAEEARRRKKEREKEKLQKKRQEGKLLTAKQKEEARRLESMRKQILANAERGLPLYQRKIKPKPILCQENNSSPAKMDLVESKKAGENKVVPDSNPIKTQEDETKRKIVEVADRNRTKDVSEESLRSPVCCIMGHVDAGKTKLLDRIRGTNVQEGEAGGITQQIGATYFPAENIRERTKEIISHVDHAKLKVPGLLVIDTPGHESFSKLRSHGSDLCDIAILVVDIMHGLERQTIESLNLLKMRNADFIVALNKVDRLYGWKTCRHTRMKEAIEQQSKDVRNEFRMRLDQIITQFKEQGLNTDLYYSKGNIRERYSIVPTSAITGEGIPELLWLILAQWTRKNKVEKPTYSDQVQCTVLEVEVVEGLGTTIDVVLVNGVLHGGDRIVVCGKQGPIVTTIRSLLTPHPMKELRVEGTYLHHKEIKAVQGIKIMAQGLEHASTATGLYVVRPQDDLEEIKEKAMEDHMKSDMSGSTEKSGGEGVCVQASTLGSSEALLDFLKTPEVNIPVCCTSIGPVHKKDVIKASLMLEKKKEFAAILAFDVKVAPEARELADELGVKIFTADVIYHLFHKFKAYIDNLKEGKKKEAADEAVFPCILKILANKIFNKKDPIILGVEVLQGIAKVGTPICIPEKDFIDIGRIVSINNSDRKSVNSANKGQEVTIKIVGTNPEEQKKIYGRHFKDDNKLVSRISRRSIDMLKANYLGDVSREEWELVRRLKRVFKIL